MPIPFELGECYIVNDVMVATEVLLFPVFLKQDLIEGFKTEEQRHALRISHVFDQVPIMHDILCHERRPTADFRVLAHELTHLKHIFAIVRKVVVEENYRWIPAAETEERTGRQGVVDRSRKMCETILSVTTDLVRNHAETAPKTASP